MPQSDNGGVAAGRRQPDNRKHGPLRREPIGRIAVPRSQPRWLGTEVIGYVWQEGIVSVAAGPAFASLRISIAPN